MPQTLTVSFWSPTGLDPNAQRQVLRIRGSRVDSDGLRERFMREEPLDGVPSGMPFALTAHLHGVGPGEWKTTAEVVGEGSWRNRGARRRRSVSRESLIPAGWSWRRWELRGAATAVATAGPTALARVPGVARGSWAAAVVLGLVVAVLSQELLLARAGLDPRWGLLSAIAVAVGAVGARLWYRFLHRGHPSPGRGWAVQGFVTGVVLVLALALLIVGGPAGPVLDATAPGLLLGLGIGRVGCFFGGCCAGRPTRSRFGVLASDRRLLVRRTPTQLYEAASSLALGAAVLAALILVPTAAGTGVVFVAALTSHVLVRQLILPKRAEARQTRCGRLIVLVSSVVVLLSAVMVAALMR